MDSNKNDSLNFQINEGVGVRDKLENELYSE